MQDHLRQLNTIFIAGFVALLLSACSDSGGSDDPTAVSACDQLINFNDTSVEITTAEVLEPIPHCRVVGTIDTDIGFELLLPDDWNGRFLMGGGGGFVGSIQNSAQTAPFMHGGNALERGYATAGTDTGHQASLFVGSWALNNQRAKENFGYRAVHRTTEVSKAIISSHYSSSIDYSYFFGCSRGGGQGLISAQRYPEDFDGIVAGAPALDWTGVTAGMVRTQQQIFPDPANTDRPIITAANRELLSNSINAQCDAIDGVADGVLADPRACTFDPVSLPRCENGAGDMCLTEPQLAAVQAIYDPLVVDGKEIYTGWPYGGETVGWPFWITKDTNQTVLPTDGTPNAGYAFGTEVFRHFIFSDPDWSYADYDFADFVERARPTAELLNSTDPDMSALRDRGGKLILWHGWSDAALSARDSIDYYESVAALDSSVDDYFRMFLLPGVAHCSGGPGPDKVDWMSAIEDWVEHHSAPESLIASKLSDAGDLTMQRPVCAYPAGAVYDGQGDTQAATSFTCEAPSGR